MLGLITRQVPVLLSGCRVFAACCLANRTGEAGVHRIAPIEPLDRCEFVDVLSIQLMPRVPKNLGVGRCGISQRVAATGTNRSPKCASVLQRRCRPLVMGPNQGSTQTASAAENQKFTMCCSVFVRGLDTATVTIPYYVSSSSSLVHRPAASSSPMVATASAISPSAVERCHSNEVHAGPPGQGLRVPILECAALRLSTRTRASTRELTTPRLPRIRRIGSSGRTQD